MILNKICGHTLKLKSPSKCLAIRQNVILTNLSTIDTLFDCNGQLYMTMVATDQAEKNFLTFS